MGPFKGLRWAMVLAALGGGGLGVVDRLPEGSADVALGAQAAIPSPESSYGAPQQAATSTAQAPLTVSASKEISPSTLDIALPKAPRPAASRTVIALQKETRRQPAKALNEQLLAYLPRPKQKPSPAPIAANAPAMAYNPPQYRPQKDAFAAAAIEPAAAPSPYALNTLAYAALANGDRQDALSLFAQSLAINPRQPDVQSQVGFIEKARGNYSAARRAFAAAASFGRVQPSILRELSQVSRPLRMSAYTVWRQNSRQINDAAFGPSLAQSQSGLGASYRLPVDGWASRHGLSATSRLLWAYDPESLSPDGRSVQAGIGLQLRPFEALNIVTAVERLLAIGDDARNDWLLRTSYSAGRGYEPELGKNWWLHWSTYLDAAVIDPSDPDIQILGDARVGLGHQPFEGSSLTVIPFAGLSGIYEDAGGRTTDLYEAAAGVWLRLWPGGPEITDPARALDLRLEYREKLGGDSPSKSGMRVTLGVTY
ncbi:MAG: hypothetical protein AAF337_11985 [Pseudomonadota bacterium]